jgi:membrane associated rhomboid family serine protease
MLIPLGTDRPLKRPTRVVHWLIAINVIVFLSFEFIQRFDAEAARYLTSQLWLSVEGEIDYKAVYRERIDRGEITEEQVERFAREAREAEGDSSLSFKLWSPITYQFMHGGWLHLIGNMLFLWVFGPNIEDRFGRRWFTVFYLLGGMAAGAAHLVFASKTGANGLLTWVPPVVGASGSIAAVTGAYLCMFPRTNIKVFYFFFIIGIASIPALWFIGISIAFDLIYKAGSQFGGLSSAVAYEAHLGGYAFGFAVAYLALASGKLPREPYDLFTMHKQARRRRAYRDLVEKQGTGGWQGDLPKDAAVRAPATEQRLSEAQRSRRDAADEAAAADRARIAEMVERGELDEAVNAYRRMLEIRGEQPLHRNAQLAVANHLNASGHHADAVTAYNLFTSRFPSDPETNRVYVLLALVQARHLNDPVAAAESLSKAKTDRLSEGERKVAESLRQELG